MQEGGDLRYVWAAFKQGGLRDIDPIFESDMTPDEFSQIFTEYMTLVYNGPAFFLIGQTLKGSQPLGFIATYSRGDRILEVGRMEWFPWAGKRAVMEATINFFNEMRRDHLIFGYIHQRHDESFKRHYAARNILRRVGVLHGLYADAPAVLYQTRRWGDW